MTDAHTYATNPNKRPRIFEDNDVGFLSPAYSKAPWTASRCYRLLRPIESRIGMLRRVKGKDTNTEDKEERGEKRRKFENGTSAEREKTPGTNSSSDEENSSPSRRRRDVEGEREWVPNPWKLRGVLKHSYKYGRLNKNRKLTVGGGPKPRPEENTPPGQLTLHTPFISRHFGPVQMYGAGADGCGPVGQTPGILCEQDMNAGRGARKRRRLQGSWEVHNASCGSHFNEKSHRATEPHLVKDLSQLLYATNSSDERTGGSRSLLSMCLRKLPSIIRQEQKEVDELDPEESYDVSTHMYNYLESEYSLSYGSWKPLRELARAQGVHILCNGIRDGLIPADMSKMLYLAARKNRAARESGQILDAIVSVQRIPIAPPNSSCALLADIPGLGLLDKEHVIQFTTGDMRTVRGWDSFSDPVGNIFSQLTCLLSRCLLPLEWLSATDMNMMLKVAIRSIAQGDKYALDAFRLVETTLAVAVGVGNDAVSEEVHAVRIGMIDKSHTADAQVRRRITRYTTSTLPTTTQTTISSLIALMTAIEILQSQQNSSNDKSTSRPRYINPMIHGVSIAIQQRRELDSFSPQQESPRSPICILEAGQVLLGHFLLFRLSSSSGPVTHESTGIETPLLETFAELMNSFHSDGNDLSAFETVITRFINDVVRVCGRAHADKGFALLQQIVTLMTASGRSFLVEYPDVRGFFARVAIDSAMAFAERVARKECFEWAASVSKSMGECAVRGMGRRRSAEDQGKSNGGRTKSFMWDGDICEWVQEIPVPRPVAVALCCDARKGTTSICGSAGASSCASVNTSKAESLSTSTSGSTFKRATSKSLTHARQLRHPRQHQHRHLLPQMLQVTNSEVRSRSQTQRSRTVMDIHVPALSVLALTASTEEQVQMEDDESDSDDLDELSSDLIVLPSSLSSRVASTQVLCGPMEKWRPQSRVKREPGHSEEREAENKSESDELSFDMSTHKPERKVSVERPGNRGGILVDEGSSEDELSR
jgi:hypothetical protein